MKGSKFDSLLSQHRNSDTSVFSFASISDFPVTGSAYVLYVDLSTSKSYIWNPVSEEYISVGGGGGTTNDKGYFLNATELSITYPIGQAGWYATVGNDASNATIYVWDNESSAWVNTGTPAITPGHTIQDEGVSLAQRAKLNFKGSLVSSADNAVNDATDITIDDTYQILTANIIVYVDVSAGNDDTGDGTQLLPRKTLNRALKYKIYTGQYSYIIQVVGDVTIDGTIVSLLNNIIGAVNIRGSATELVSGVNIGRTANFTYTLNSDLGVDTYKGKHIGVYTSSNRSFSGFPLKTHSGTVATISGVSGSLTNRSIVSLPNLSITNKIVAPACNLTLNGRTVTLNTSVGTQRVDSVLSIQSCNLNMNGKYFVSSYEQVPVSINACNVYGATLYITYRMFVNFNSNSVVHVGAAQNTLYGGTIFCGGNIIDGGESFIWSSRGWKTACISNEPNQFMNMPYVIIGGHDTNIKFFSYNGDGWNCKLTNIQWFFGMSSYQDGAGVVNVTISDNQAMDGTPTVARINHGTYKNFKYLDVERNVNVNIVGTYPEMSGNASTTLTAGASGYLEVGSSTENRAIEVNYTLSRDTYFKEGKIRLLNDGTNVEIFEEGLESGDCGITWDSATIVSGVIRLNYTITTGNNISINYNSIRQMIF